MSNRDGIIARTKVEFDGIAPALEPVATSRKVTYADLTDRSFLREQMTTVGQAWGSEDDRVMATMWWYAIGNTFSRIPVLSGFGTGEALDPDFSAAEIFTWDENTYVLGYRPEAVVPAGNTAEWTAVGEAFARACAPVLEALSAESETPLQALWALTGDSVQSALTEAANELLEPRRGLEVAEALEAGMRTVVERLPQARFFDVTADAVLDGGTSEDEFDTRLELRRASCCLFIDTQYGALCTSCPRRPLEDRKQDWMAMAGGGM